MQMDLTIFYCLYIPQLHHYMKSKENLNKFNFLYFDIT